MKIFNVRPIKVARYLFNEEHLAKSASKCSYESSFGYNGKKTESLNTFVITFNILHHAGEDNDLLLSYKSYSQFNFESGGFDADVLSIMKFLNEYYKHTAAFFEQYGLKTIPAMEEEIGVDRGGAVAHLANWTSLKNSDSYSKSFTAVSFMEEAD